MANRRHGWEMARAHFGLKRVPQGLRVLRKYFGDTELRWKAEKNRCAAPGAGDTVH